MLLCLKLGPPGLNCWIYFTLLFGVYTIESLSLFYLIVYLDLYLLGDDTSISQGFLMQTKHLFVLIHIRNKDEAGTIKVV